MNQKIKELAEQAGTDFSVPIFSDNDKGSEFRHFDVGKFAELIIQEMLQTCEDHPGWTGRMIGEQIKQHFGVEE